MALSISTSGIVAEAFRLIEAEQASSLADGSDMAVAANTEYPLALRECLEAGDWSFASTLAALPEAALPSNVAADEDLPYFYKLPGNCIRLQQVGDDWTAWRLDAAGLRADEPAPLTIRYTAEVTTEAVLPATFRFLVSLVLAIRLSPYFQSNVEKLEQLRGMMTEQRRKALRQDASTASAQRIDDLDQADDWVSMATR